MNTQTDTAIICTHLLVFSCPACRSCLNVWICCPCSWLWAWSRLSSSFHCSASSSDCLRRARAVNTASLNCTTSSLVSESIGETEWVYLKKQKTKNKTNCLKCLLPLYWSTCAGLQAGLQTQVFFLQDSDLIGQLSDCVQSLNINVGWSPWKKTHIVSFFRDKEAPMFVVTQVWKAALPPSRPVVASFSSSCWRSLSLVLMDSSRRWRRHLTSCRCSSIKFTPERKSYNKMLYCSFN